MWEYLPRKNCGNRCLHSLVQDNVWFSLTHTGIVACATDLIQCAEMLLVCVCDIWDGTAATTRNYCVCRGLNCDLHVLRVAELELQIQPIIIKSTKGLMGVCRGTILPLLGSWWEDVRNAFTSVSCDFLCNMIFPGISPTLFFSIHCLQIKHISCDGVPGFINFCLMVF